MEMAPDGTYPYKGILDCAVKTAQTEGILAFWAGLPTYFFRVTPHAIIVLFTAEKLKTVFGV